MRCSRVRKHFDALLDGRADERVQLGVENHLAACRSCAEEYTFRCKLARGLRDWPRPSARSVPSPLDALSLAEVERPEAGVASTGGVIRWIRSQPRDQLLAAALIVVGLGVTHLLAFWLGDANDPTRPDETTAEFAELSRDQLPRLVENHIAGAEMLSRIASQDGEHAAELFDGGVGQRFVSDAHRLTSLTAKHDRMRGLHGELVAYTRALDSLATADASRIRAVANSLTERVSAMRRRLVDLDADVRDVDDPSQAIHVLVGRMFHRDFDSINRIASKMIERGQVSPAIWLPVLEGVRAGDDGAIGVAARLVEKDPRFVGPLSKAIIHIRMDAGVIRLTKQLEETLQRHAGVQMYLWR